MNPPLRTQADVDALRAGVADGTIDILATDHAPHTLSDKSVDFDSAAFGIVGLDCALALYEKALLKTGLIDWPRLVALLSIEPARLVGLDRTGIGRLEVGLPADITVIDPNAEWSIDPDRFRSKGRNCPFAGWNVHTQVVATILGGDMVHRSDNALVEA
jgi:dihydroorotase